MEGRKHPKLELHLVGHITPGLTMHYSTKMYGKETFQTLITSKSLKNSRKQ